MPKRKQDYVIVGFSQKVGLSGYIDVDVCKTDDDQCLFCKNKGIIIKVTVNACDACVKKECDCDYEEEEK